MQFNITHHWQVKPRIPRVKAWLWLFAILFMTLGMPKYGMAAIDVYEFDTPQQEAQYRALIEEFRCPKCQNQNLAGSDAPIAQDLKQKTYEMVKAGQTDSQIREYMYERYGDFISYKPPVRPSTWILWFFPPLLLLVLIIAWIWRVKRHNKLVTVIDSTASDNHDISVKSNIMPSSVLSEKEQQQLDALLSNHISQTTGLEESSQDLTESETKGR